MSRNYQLLQRLEQGGSKPQLPPPLLQGSAPVPNRPIPPQSAFPEWRRALDALQRYWRLSALFAIVVFASAATVTFLMKPVYEPTARIEIDPPGSELISMGERGPENDSEYLETQSKTLQSNQLAVDVIRKLHLEQMPELAGKARLTSGSQTPSNDPLHITPAERAALKKFQTRLKVTRDTGSRLVAVSFYSSDPQLAANVTNTMVDEYISTSMTARHEGIMKASAWLNRQLDDLRESIDQANHELTSFQDLTGIADLEENKNTFSEQVSELNRQLIQAQAERIQIESFLNKVQTSSPDALPQGIENPVVQQLTQRLADVRADLAQAQVIYGANHPNVKKLQNHANELQVQLNSQRTGILSDLKTRYAAAAGRERLIGDKLKRGSKELDEIAHYNALKKDLHAKMDLYNSLYARVKEAGIAAASKSMNIRVIDYGTVLDKPTRPRKVLNLGFGLVVSLLGGIMLALVRAAFDRTVYTLDDVRQCTGISSVCIVPSQTLADGSLRRRRFYLTGRNRRESPEKFLVERPHSPEAEAVRGLQVSIMLSRLAHQRAVLIASPLAGEGKTTVAINLAIAHAQHVSTCLVEADLRRPTIAAVFGSRAPHGLTEVLQGTSSLSEVMLQPDGIQNLSVLPAGAVPENPGELVSSAAMRALVDDLRKQFDFVVIDSPPIIPFADCRVLSSVVDSVVLVSRSGSTTRAALARSMELLAAVHSAPIAELVLNDAPFNAREYNYYYNRYAS